MWPVALVTYFQGRTHTFASGVTFSVTTNITSVYLQVSTKLTCSATLEATKAQWKPSIVDPQVLVLVAFL